MRLDSSSHGIAQKPKIPQTAVWGSFKSLLQAATLFARNESPKRQFGVRSSSLYLFALGSLNGAGDQAHE